MDAAMPDEVHDKRQRLIDRVALTRRRLRRNAVWTGATLLVLVAGAWLTLWAGIDLLFPLPVAGRMVAWVGFWLLVAGVAIAAVLWPALRPMRLVQIAFRIERVLGDMHNRLVTVVDLERRHGHVNAQQDPATAAFVERLIDQTDQRMTAYHPEHVASPSVARWLTVLATGLVLTLGVLTLTFNHVVGNAMWRIVRPTAPIPPIAWAALTAEPSATRVLRGEPVTIDAQATRGRIENVSLRITPDEGESRRYPMRRDDTGRFTFTFNAVERSFEYQVEGGGTWTAPQRITALARPVVEQLDAQVYLPPYMNRTEPRNVDEMANQISAPIESTVRVRVDVRGNPVDGRIDVYRTRIKQTEKAQVQERVWIDDDLPPDAERIGEWHWVRDRVYSGSRAHTFDWRHSPYGFRTHLNPLEIDKEESMFVYIWLDPDDPPEQLRFVAKGEKQTHRLLWGSEPTEVQKKQKFQHLGSLPEPGTWRRLPLTPHRRIVLHELTFQTDGGRVVFDRVGTLARVERTVEQTILEKVDTLPMQRDSETGEWTGEIPVEADRRFTVTFQNALGHESAAMKPMPILATKDQPPTLVVERPGRSVTINRLDAVPLMVRAFDDYGVAEVTVAAGEKADALREPRTIGAFTEPRTSRVVMDALDPDRLELAPGTAVHYRVSVRDQKGQVTHSEPFRLALAGETDTRAADAGEPQRTPFDDLLDHIGELVTVQGEIVGGAADLLGELPALVTPKVDAFGTVELTNKEGEPLTAEEKQALLAEWQAQLDEEQRQAWAETAQQLAEQRGELTALADQMDAAASAAADSPQALPMSPQAMRELAEHARVLAGSMPDPQAQADQSDDDANAIDPDVLERLVKLNGLTDAQESELSQLQNQLQQLSDAQRDLAVQPIESQQRVADLMTQLRAQQQVQQMQDLDAQLEDEHTQLRQLRERVAQLQEQTPEADAQQLDQISEEQQALDAEALQELEEIQGLLATDDEQLEVDDTPPAPWTPPGRESEAMPVEQDTPEEDPQQDEGDQADAASQNDPTEEAASEAEEEDEDWWDQPVDAPEAPGNQGEQSERYADRNRPTEDASPRIAEAGDEPPSPREQLMEHQQQLDRSLTENSNRVVATRDQMHSLADQMRQALSQAGRSDNAGRESTAQQLQQLMQSSRMQRTQAMASRAAARSRAAQARTESQGDAENDTGPPRGGEVMILPLEPLDANATVNASTYRLPPALRQPVMEGMNERGPAAYQPMIDAYYHELTEEAGEE